MKKNNRFYSMYSAFISSIIILFATGLVGTASICLAQDGSWTTIENLQIPRHSHGTVVVNGKIYAIGGVTTDGGCSTPAIQTVEEYDPLTDTWTTKADMPTARVDFSLSAVNGKIYVIGGNPALCSDETSTVDEYDPLTDTWDTTKTPMQSARVGFSSHVVNGKIYAIGGWKFSTSPSIYVADVEEYDPLTDTWITKADMPTARAWFSSSVVDGKIYVFGGQSDGEMIKSVEVYDPVTNTWSTKADMPIVLQNFTATTIDSLVYVFGGLTSPSVPVSDVRKYNPISDTWSTIDHIPTETRVFGSSSSNQLDGNIYIIFGSTTDWPFHPASTVQVYTPPVITSGGSWTTKADMQFPRFQHGTCVVSEKIYAIGGVTTGTGVGSPGSQKVEEYNPSTDTWSTKTDMLTARESLSISAVNGKIYAIGGDTHVGSGELSTVEEYDPLTDTWSTKTNMQVARAGLSTSGVKGKIYAIGGWKYSTNTALADVEEYDPITDTWITKADMQIARTWFSSSVVDGKIYVFGGVFGLSSVEVYDPVTNTWSPKADMPIGFGSSTASTVNSLVYIFGGFSPGSESRSEVMEYNPISDTWSTISQLPSARVGLPSHSGQLNGNIYVIGGSSTLGPFQPTATVQVYTPLVTSVEDIFESKNTPTEFVLHQNYPNPFNPETTIQYQVPKTSEVKLVIFNLLGQRIATLVDEVQSMGIHSVQWHGKDDTGKEVASGVYLYRLQTEQFVQVQKLALLR